MASRVTINTETYRDPLPKKTVIKWLLQSAIKWLFVEQQSSPAPQHIFLASNTEFAEVLLMGDFNHRPYSPYLVLSDFHLSPISYLEWQCFQQDEKVEKTVGAWF